MRRLTLLLLFVTGCLSSSLPYGYHMKVGVPKALELLKYEGTHTRIIGGSTVNLPTAIPYQAGIVATLTNSWTSICGGSLLSQTRVLTAAHCWWDGQTQATQFTVVLGSVTIFTGGTRIQTKDVVVHSGWNNNDITNDLAMVKITSVTYTTSIQAIALPASNQASLNFAAMSGTVSGYGKTSDGTYPATTSLYRTTVTIMTNTDCQNTLKIPLHASHLCTSGTGKVGTCDGDSGGPLTVVQSNKNLLVGVVSFGLSEGCAVGSPSVYTRVTAFLSWIQANM